MARSGLEIAIIGMAVRVPEANTVAQFWLNLRNGVSSIRRLTNAELLAVGEAPEVIRDKNYVPYAACLDGLEQFDPEFFGLSRQEAAVMDPQHRHFLECAWEAIENAARPPKSLAGQIAVFAGCGMGTYFYSNVCSHQQLVDRVGLFLLRHTGNDKDFLATRVSHAFDLRGPSVNVQTACSTSLVAVHYACQSLLNGECDMALAGGVTIELPHRRGYTYRDGEILSPDGHCRAFDHRAAGTVFGSGAGVVVLRRLADAIADGDPIRAIIKGTAINNDGSDKASYLAPSVTGQAAAILEAQTLAGIAADTVQYVECHGTGTKLGDPIEVEALTQAFRHSTDRTGFCHIGSVKSNIGHLDTAAGVIGLIKAALALEHGEIPPTLGYEKPNPAIDFGSTPFIVCDRLTPWPTSLGPRRAGVNSLGVGGTNAHAVLEQAPVAQPDGKRPGESGPNLFVLSAKNRKALDDGCLRLADFLDVTPGAQLQDVAATLFHGRTHFTYRRVVAAKDRAQAVAALRGTGRNTAPAHKLVERTTGAVFLLPGGGAQYPGMGQALYRTQPTFRADIDEGLGYLPPDVAAAIRAIWFDVVHDTAAKFLDPARQLPAILIIEVALAKLWLRWGIEPRALIGHSMGENAAACIAGVFSFKNAVELVHLRGRLFNEIPPGGMLSIPLSEGAVRARLPLDLDLASVNAPEACVVSGSDAALNAFQADLQTDGIETMRVPIAIAAHSRMLEPILERFEAFLETITLSEPKVPIVSNQTGTWLTNAQARDPKYWRAHLRSTVRFAKGLATLAADQSRIFIEIGPGRSLTSLVKVQRTIEPNQIINSLPHMDEAVDDAVHFLAAVGRGWALGLPVPLERLWPTQGTPRVELPTYPFQHERFWIAPNASSQVGASKTLRHEALDDWFSVPTWVQSPRLTATTAPPETVAVQPRRWLIYSDGSALAGRVIGQLPGEVVVATHGLELKMVGDLRWVLDVNSANQHQELLAELDRSEFRPTDVVYCCGLARLSGPRARRPPDDELRLRLLSDFMAPTFAVRALGRQGESVNFNVVTRDLAQICDEPIDPLRATIVGPVLVAPREMPQLRTRCIDVRPSPIGVGARRFESALLGELTAQPNDQLVALRAGSRFVRSTHSLTLPPPTNDRPWLRANGVYVFTGGLGGLALETAEHLARSEKVKIALLARSELPPEEDWDDVLRLLPVESMGSQRIRRIQQIRGLGAKVVVFKCDITNAEQVERSLAAVRVELGTISGVIHAAGVMDDEPIENKTIGSMSRVLLPKIAGALNLDRLIDEPLDFFLVFSSVASVLALPGQVDYTAANAFLDAFAVDRARRAPGRTAVVNWNAWRETGMAARASVENQHGRMPSSVVSHPALDGFSDEHGVGRIFVTDFSIDKHWLLSEHVIQNGAALLSGSTFVELARAAFSAGKPSSAIEIKDLMFLAPFQVAEGTTRRLTIQIATQGGASEITMRTAGDDARSLPHVIGDISAYRGPLPSPVDVDAITARCPNNLNPVQGGIGDQHFVAFGPRWNLIRSIRQGRGESLLELVLDPKFVTDLEHYHLHPAMLDFATGAAQRLIPGFVPERDFYVPFGYGLVRIYTRMPQRILSHVRLKPGSCVGEASFDVTLMDDGGRPFCEIEGFEMKRIDIATSLVGSKLPATSKKVGAPALDKILRDAIDTRDGLAALDRIMSQPHVVQCIASSVDLKVWEREVDAEGRTGTGLAVDQDDEGAGSFTRPDLESAYVAADTDMEKRLARLWSSLLGVRQVGVNDDFFELGGHSLHAVRLFAAIRKEFGLSLPLSTLFENSNIRKLAILLDAQAARDQTAAERPTATLPSASRTVYSSLVPIQLMGEEAAFYCAAGMGGNPLNLRPLALEMGIDRPFYGLQPQGLDGMSPLHRTVPEMASHYIQEIKHHQPTGPYYLGGYSGGGVVAFEMAKQLVAAGERVGCLVFLDSIAPGVRLPSALSKLSTHSAGVQQGGGRYALEVTKRGVLRRAALLATVARKPLRQMFPYRYRLENIADTWTEAFAAYRPTAYDGDAILFRAGSGLVLGVDIGSSNGWERLFSKPIEISICPGDHASMCEAPHVRVLARRVNAHLRRRVRDNGGSCGAVGVLEKG